MQGAKNEKLGKDGVCSEVEVENEFLCVFW